MSIADLQDRAEALGRPGGIANFAEAAPGVERSEAPTVSHGEGVALCGAHQDLSQARARHVPHHQVDRHGGHASASITSVPWIRWDRGPYLPDQAVLIDFPSRRFFFFFLEIWPQEFYYITGLLVLAALGAVPRHLDRRARVVRLYLSADGVDRSDDRGRALLAGRPQPAAPARQGAVVVRDAVAQGRHASHLAPDRDRDRRRLGVLFRRRADACPPARDFRGADHRLSLRRHFHRHHLCARRPRPRAGLHLYVPLAAHPGRDVRPRFAADLLSRLARRAARAA